MLTELKRILLPTDFSESAEHAKPYAFALAKAFGAELHVAHAENTAYLSYVGMYGQGAVIEPNLEQFRAEARAGMQTVLDEAATAGLRGEAHFVIGAPASELTRLAESERMDLIVIGSHGRSGFDRFVLGSTAEAIVRRSSVPVLTVKLREHEFVRGHGVSLNTILCPCDLSGRTPAAVQTAAEWARRFGAKLVLFHVLDERLDYLALAPEMPLVDRSRFRANAEEALARFASGLSGISVDTVVDAGAPHKQIAAAVIAMKVDLIIMQTHGHGPVSHLVLGSTAERTVRLAACPVLTFRPSEASAN